MSEIGPSACEWCGLPRAELTSVDEGRNAETSPRALLCIGQSGPVCILIGAPLWLTPRQRLIRMGSNRYLLLDSSTAREVALLATSSWTLMTS